MGVGNQTGDITGWPKLVIKYRTEPEKLVAILPPGLHPGSEPIVTIGVYCVPVLGEPEYGISTRVQATYNGITGDYSLGIGIDQEAAIFSSQEINGQPKFPCAIRYFRIGNSVEAIATHQGYTFLKFCGQVIRNKNPKKEDLEHNEWWIKYSRAIGGHQGKWDYPPHVVKVRQISNEVLIEDLEGELILLDSPWDPIKELLPLKEQISAQLITSIHKLREISNAGPLDPESFWAFADTIGGSRWPGFRGGPRKSTM